MSKKQNAAIGAVIGGALLGPLGVAVGAAMGAISTDESVSLDNNLLQSDIDIQEKMKKIISPYSSDDFYKAEKSIPQKKLEAAILNYPVPRQETILALVDATLFGSAKNGLVIGLQGIYWKNDWTTETTKNFLSWDEMVESSKSISTTLLTSDVVFGNGCVFNMSSSQMKTKTLAELLNKLVLLHKQKYIQQNTKPTNTASVSLSSNFDDISQRLKNALRNDSLIGAELLKLHNKSLQKLILQFSGDNEFADTILNLFCVLIDEQLKIIASQVDAIKNAITKEVKLTQEKDLISPVIQVSLFVFLCVHNYSLSKLPSSFLDVLLSKNIYLQAITLRYLEIYSGYLNDLYQSDEKILDSEFMVSIPLVFFDKTEEERYLNISREKLLMGLLERVNMSGVVAQNISNKFDITVRKWYEDMGAFLDAIDDEPSSLGAETIMPQDVPIGRKECKKCGNIEFAKYLSCPRCNNSGKWWR